MRTRTVVMVLLGCLLIPGSSLRAEPAPPLAELGVDQVTLKHGPRLLGTVFERSNGGSMTIAVTCGWMKNAQPKFYDSCAAEAVVERRAALEQLRDRLAEWSERRVDESKLAFFLKKQAERVDRGLAEKDSNANAPDDADFLFIPLTRVQVERVFFQPPSRKQIVLVAWREGLGDVETRSARSLGNELQKKGIDPAKERVDLSDRMPTRKQSDTEWAARQALVEYVYRNAIDFQGTGELIVRTGEGAKAPAAGELLAGVLKQQISGLLSDLPLDSSTTKGKPESNAWLKSAIATAEQEDARGFRVTRIAPDSSGSRASVETCFVARLAVGRWETIWRHTESVESAHAEKNRVERISEDPQIRQVLELVKAAGLGDGETQLQSALRYGAATMQAQEAADARFAEFRDRYLQRLEGPPLPLALGDN